MRFVNPVGLNPGDDIVVARDRDQPALGATHRFLNRMRGDLGNLAVDDAGEFVDHEEIGSLSQPPRHRYPELFTIAESVKGTKPGWRRGESDRRKKAGDLLDTGGRGGGLGGRVIR